MNRGALIGVLGMGRKAAFGGVWESRQQNGKERMGRFLGRLRYNHLVTAMNGIPFANSSRLDCPRQDLGWGNVTGPMVQAAKNSVFTNTASASSLTPTNLNSKHGTMSML